MRDYIPDIISTFYSLSEGDKCFGKRKESSGVRRYKCFVGGLKFNFKGEFREVSLRY